MRGPEGDLQKFEGQIEKIKLKWDPLPHSKSPIPTSPFFSTTYSSKLTVSLSLSSIPYDPASIKAAWSSVINTCRSSRFRKESIGHTPAQWQPKRSGGGAWLACGGAMPLILGGRSPFSNELDSSSWSQQVPLDLVVIMVSSIHDENARIVGTHFCAKATNFAKWS